MKNKLIELLRKLLLPEGAIILTRAEVEALGEYEKKCRMQSAECRMASEVAEEIFAEIEKKVKASLTVHLEEINKEHIKDTPLYDRHSGIIFALKGMGDFIAELKKKYTEN